MIDSLDVVLGPDAMVSTPPENVLVLVLLVVELVLDEVETTPWSLLSTRK